MESLPELIRERPRSCWIQIDIGNLRENLQLIRTQLDSGDTIMAVVKAEAYGHGAEVVSRTLSSAGVDVFGVATLEEAIKLRKFGIKDKILILGHLATFTSERILDYDFTPVVFSYRLLQALEKEASSRNQTVPVHLKIDTGMGRLGILPDQLPGFLDKIRNSAHVELEGVATHFAQAAENPYYTDEQINTFKEIQTSVLEQGLKPDYWHCMNSAALFAREEVIGNMVRPGITIYGYPPNDDLENLDLKPVMQVKTKLADYKQMPAGKGVSYGRTFKPDEPTWIGTMPLGYADGYSRHFSNTAHVLKRGRRCPVIGKVCMDMTVISLDENDDPEETVTVMGKDNGESLWADKLADWDNTIPYEILSSFSDRLPRIYTEENEAIAIKTEQNIKEL